MSRPVFFWEETGEAGAALPSIYSLAKHAWTRPAKQREPSDPKVTEAQPGPSVGAGGCQEGTEAQPSWHRMSVIQPLSGAGAEVEV